MKKKVIVFTATILGLYAIILFFSVFFDSYKTFSNNIDSVLGFITVIGSVITWYIMSEYEKNQFSDIEELWYYNESQHTTLWIIILFINIGIICSYYLQGMGLMIISGIIGFLVLTLYLKNSHNDYNSLREEALKERKEKVRNEEKEELKTFEEKDHDESDGNRSLSQIDKETKSTKEMEKLLERVLKRSKELAEDIIAEDYSISESDSTEEGLMVDEELFEELRKTTLSIIRIIIDSCHQESFLALLRKASNTMGKPDDYIFNFKSMLIKDVSMYYDEMGYVEKMNLSTAHGLCLYIITRVLTDYDAGDDYLFYQLKMDVSDDFYRKFCMDNVRKRMEIYNNVDNKAALIDGHEDFRLIIAFAIWKDEITEYLRMLLFRMNQLIVKADGKISIKVKIWLKQILKNQELLEALYTDDDGNPVPKQAKKEWIAKAEQSIDALKQTRKKVSKKEVIQNAEMKKWSIPNTEISKSSIDELNELIGLSETKKEITTLSNYIQMKLKRDEMGMKSPNVSLHCVFTGNPGTGKTTVARILAGIYKNMGLLKKGHLVETDRSGLIAEYLGQTAVKTNKIIDEALDGVLFIDEAYSLVQGAKGDYGPEAVSTLLKRMEDDRDRLVVIVAGYTKEMEDFINSNPGLQSRFNRYIHFTDYSAEELYDIFCLQMKKNEYTISDSASQRLKAILADAVANKEKDFGNARFVRNLFEKVIENQANRLANEQNPTKELLAELIEEDFNL